MSDKEFITTNDLREALGMRRVSDPMYDKTGWRFNREENNKGCDFCEELFTGDCNESLAETKLKFEGTTTPFMFVDLFINDDEIEAYGDTASGDTVFKLKKKIFYCPMCGRRLEREQNKDIASSES